MQILRALPVPIKIPENRIDSGNIHYPEKYVKDLVKAAGKNKKHARQVLAMLLCKKEKPPARETANDYFYVNEKNKDPNPKKGLTRMYVDRVLVSPSGACMTHCPWCFRDERSGLLSEKNINEIIRYIQKDKRIRDIILTGGEPFSFPVRRLKALLAELDSIRHIKIIRFHTRAPATAPHIFTKEIFNILNRYHNKNQKIYIVLQIIHPLELSDEVKDVVFKMSKTGCALLNQAPVLKGINDDQETFNAWNRALIEAGIKPYYAIIPIIRHNWNSRYAVPYDNIKKLVSNYASRFDGLGRPTIILPVMRKKISALDLERLMKTHPGVHYRNTKSQIWG
ncbi:radical SAM protein [Spirochaetota bacterium]